MLGRRGCSFVLPVLFLLIFEGGVGAEGRAGSRVLVKLSNESGSSAALSIQSNQPPTGWKYLKGVDLYIVDETGQGSLESLQESGAVEAMESEEDIHLEALPNDPMVSGQGWITGGVGLSGGLDIGIAEAWSLVTGSTNVIVAVIDSGIDPEHPDLKTNLWTNPHEVAGNGGDDDNNGFVDDIHGFNFKDHNSDIHDENGHGSHMAGIIGAVGNNGVGVAGINWNVRLMPLKFTDAQGSGTSAGAIESINYAIENGANIINASWTLKLDRVVNGEDNLLKQAIEKAGEAGILFVTASGNQFDTGIGLNVDRTPVYPVKFGSTNLIAVAAVDNQGNPASYSNYGPLSVGIAAPGTGILSTMAHKNYGSMTGTSISTAFVSGAADLMLSLQPSLTPEQIKSPLLGSVTSKDSLKNFVSSGGILNIGKAVTSLQGAAAPSASSGGEPPPVTAPASSLIGPTSGGCSLIPDF